MITQIIAATLGTVAFAVLFGAPKKYYPYCGIVGGCSWIVYIVFSEGGTVVASLAATVAVVFLSRLMAIWEQCPVTIFLISGIFPLVPGSYVYWTAYYLVTDQVWKAAENGYMAVKIAFAIVLGIVFVFEIPQSAIRKLLGCEKTEKRTGEKRTVREKEETFGETDRDRRK